MASSSGNSSESTQIANSGSESDLQQMMDERKRKRKQSNRESAKRSRMRKQKHLDDLTAQVSRLSKENGHIAASISTTTQHYLRVEAENSVLRARMAELSQRLESLNDILSLVNNPNLIAEEHFDGFMNMNHFNLGFMNQPIMASAEMFQY